MLVPHDLYEVVIDFLGPLATKTVVRYCFACGQLVCVALAENSRSQVEVVKRGHAPESVLRHVSSISAWK